MIPRSIWRWRKTDPAARRSDRNLCSCSLSVLFLPRRKSRSREKNGGDCKLCESAVFHYTHYNESSESKSLLRAIESARQMSTNIKMETENGGQLREDFLKEKRKTNPAARWSDWNLRGSSLSVLFLPRRKSGSREKNGRDCKLCESAVFHLHSL